MKSYREEIGKFFYKTNYSDKVIIEFVGINADKFKLVFPEVELNIIGSEKIYVRNN